MRTNVIVNDEGINFLVEKTNSLVWTEKDQTSFDNLRLDFVNHYTKEKIDGLTKEEYFAGMGTKKGCIAYDLEWGTRDLGSIKGGSKYKYGYEADFPKIKKLLQKIVSINPDEAYTQAGDFSSELNQIGKLSKDINGFKTGKTVLPKLLSIYYPQTFLPFFNDQSYFISKLVVNGLETENTGVEQYFEFNFKLLKVKKKLEEVLGRKLDSHEFSRLLYFTFPKGEALSSDSVTLTQNQDDDVKFEALEVQHYQTLLHRNFKRLFPNLRYFDEEVQVPRNGQYDTEAVGIMDILAIDEKGNFVVIEIKRQGTDKTIGQILRYMGWTKEELCKEGKTVKGIIVAEKKDIYLDFALKVMADVKFLKLGLTISLVEE